MENIKITQELIEKAKGAKSPEELQTLAAENGIQFTMEQAEKKYDQMHSNSKELSDEELDNVVGGACFLSKCPHCGSEDLEYVGYYSIEYDIYRCRNCGEETLK